MAIAMSYMQAVRVALWPGAAESLKKRPGIVDSNVLAAKVDEVIRSRNAFYAGVVITVVGNIQAASTNDDNTSVSAFFRSFSPFIFLGCSVAFLSGGQLIERVLSLQGIEGPYQHLDE